ncbi:hypothetical protein DPEC_G00006950 [Dallia pectoralis]|uniref:Uncharacterized protein n=1 Tax=Dallia pectoralis TaxID=75939 RepID=A0ACC2HKA9_DALPE|nr:hypothetical protein DPEC_G00006950 [Dallia pectoralis]
MFCTHLFPNNLQHLPNSYSIHCNCTAQRRFLSPPAERSSIEVYLLSGRRPSNTSAIPSGENDPLETCDPSSACQRANGVRLWNISRISRFCAAGSDDTLDQTLDVMRQLICRFHRKAPVVL